MELIRISFDEEDVRSLAQAAGIPFETALQRAEGWASHIEATATALCNEQLSSVIRTDQP